MTPEQKAYESKRILEEILEGAAGRAKYQTEIRRAANAAISSIDAYEATREAELSQVRKEFQKEVDRERARAVRTARDLEVANNKLSGRPPREIEIGDNGNMVRFPAPLSEHGHQRKWTLGELESIIYDLRLAGADDRTVVDVQRSFTQALVPFPEAVTTARSALPAMPESSAPAPSPSPGLVATLAKNRGRLLLVLLQAVVGIVSFLIVMAVVE